MPLVLCLFIHNIGSKHDRETITSKLTFYATHITRITSSSETQGQSVGSGKGRDESFQVRAEEPLGTDSHRTISKHSSGCWLLIGHKNTLYYCAQSANSFSWVLFVSSYTTAIVSPHLPGSFTKLVCARETFILYFPNQQQRNYRWVEQTFGMLSGGATEFAPRIFCFWWTTMYRK